MNCWFCNNDLPIDQSKFGGTDNAFKTYWCKDCLAQFTVMEFIGQVTEYHFYWKEYKVDVDVANSEWFVEKGEKKKLATPTPERPDTYIQYKIILRMRCPANLTPKNIESKLPIYLVFS